MATITGFLKNYTFFRKMWHICPFLESVRASSPALSCRPGSGSGQNSCSICQCSPASETPSHAGGERYLKSISRSIAYNNKINIQCRTLIVRIIPLYIGATFDLECDPTYVLQHRPVLTPLRNWAGTEEHLRLPQKITHEEPHLMEKYTCIVLVLIFSFTW